ncbi:CrcB family protein [Micromonospora tulbaghiae]|uniref:Fluoride-specific ion channel FluC n=1 Tax=Micromonospora tulbaghiae TaxID=479978 RepID=A0ABY0KIJ3_9ACTN|nr:MULTISPECIES: CrcB family protein [Micromonospora]KAB1900811.1 CrcB family protein [Micromonospora sp. AMSO1212t]MDX5460414.1 CrcB family protein [Micromonospora tulbaghiae]SCE76879.1 camphor resistance protein CrcB [Micromonospora tulbaghiae]
MTILLIALGAAIGAPLRYLTDRAVQARHGSPFPWGTLTVNVAGSVLLGGLLAAPVAPGVTALVGTGFCGALTTWSTLSYETLRLARTGERRPAYANVTLSVVAGLGAAFLGYAVVTALSG